ncbi:hypothetical protein Hsc_0165 [Herbaspirillum seropedicae]|nr:hypothetical protein Hsc_0165 [Herbaspirillum seropedicae]
MRVNRLMAKRIEENSSTASLNQRCRVLIWIPWVLLPVVIFLPYRARTGGPAYLGGIALPDGKGCEPGILPLPGKVRDASLRSTSMPALIGRGAGAARQHHAGCCAGLPRPASILMKKGGTPAASSLPCRPAAYFRPAM